MDSTFHYPPDLLELLVETVPRLFRSKPSVLQFFQGAGVPIHVLSDLKDRVRIQPDDISKFEIVRTTLVRLNEGGDALLAQRREVIKRVAEFEEFSTCWEEDRLSAQGLVAQVRGVVNTKDSFTRINIERERERQQRRAERESWLAEVQAKKTALESVKADLFALFGMSDPQKRGKKLENVLNRLFQNAGILVRQDFVVVGNQNEGIVEQIDGAIELGSDLYLVEMKWWGQPLGPAEISPHIVKVYNRPGAGGIIISASGYTDPAVSTCKEALAQRVVVLCDLGEIVQLLDREGDLVSFLRSKIQAAVLDKNPFVRNET